MRAQAAGGVDFDERRLRAFLDDVLPGGKVDLSLERVGGGQSNPTYFFTRGGARLVLSKAARRRPDQVRP